jgi:hypothetical protein
MRKLLSALSGAALAVLLCSCATVSVKQTSKSPDCPPGPVKKVAVVAVADQANVRPGLENRFVHDIGQNGQPAMSTVELMRLSDIKENKEEAAKRMREGGADSVLIVRLVHQTTYNQQARTSGAGMVPVVTGYGGYGWYGYYNIAFMDMGASHGTLRDKLMVDSSLFDLNTGQRLWSALTRTTLTEDADRLVVADELVAKITAAMRKDGLVR